MAASPRPTAVAADLVEQAARYHDGFVSLEEVADALHRSGRDEEASWLRPALKGAGPHALDGAWEGRRLFAGRRPPAGAAIGDVWMDLVELTPCVKVPLVKVLRDGVTRRVGPIAAGWMGMWPLRAWQLALFERMARVRWSASVEVAYRFRSRRWDGFGREGFAAGCLHVEASACAAWLSKVLPSSRHHNAFYLALPLEAQACLPGRGRGEWQEWAVDVQGGETGPTVVRHQSFLRGVPVPETAPFSPRRLFRTFLPGDTVKRRVGGADAGFLLAGPAPR